MKRALVAGILGIAAASTAFGQGGHVLVWNYAVAPYNQVVWDISVPTVGGTSVNDNSVQLQIWYALGNVTDPGLLQPGNIFTVNPTYTYDGGAGPGGYYDPQTQVIPGWSSGDVTFQIRASGDTAYGPATGSSALWNPTGVALTTLPANTDQNSIGLTVIVPEPSTLALAGLGIASLLILRRRKA